jgi:hypothetical protein
VLHSITIVLWVLIVTAVTSEGYQYPQQRHAQEDLDGLASHQPDAETSDRPPRAIISPFSVTLRKTVNALSYQQLESVRTAMENIVTDYIRSISSSGSNSTDSTPKLQYVLFGEISQDFLDEIDATYVSVNLGVASYDRNPIPESNQVNAWVSTSLQTNLIPALHDVGFSSDIESVSVSLQRPPAPTTQSTTPTQAPKPSANNVAANNEEEESQKSSNESNELRGMYAGITGGAIALVITASIMLAWSHRRRKRQMVEIENMGPVFINSFSKEMQNDDEEQQQQQHHQQEQHRPAPGERSVAADSESDWTVATEAGDSTALKSIHPNPTTPITVPPDDKEFVFSESFQRDRPVNISKDMLTGAFSGRAIVNNNARGSMYQSESVLQPSHFSASQERRVRSRHRWSAEMDEQNALVFESAYENGSSDRRKPGPENSDVQ